MRADRAGYLERDTWFATLYADPKHRLASAEDVLASMNEAGVDRTVVMGFPWKDAGLCRDHNDYIIEVVNKYPDKLIGFACVQPLDSRDAQELERCLNAGLMGLGELGPDGQRFDVEDRWAVSNAATVLMHHDRPLLIHSSEPIGHDYACNGSA